MHLRKCAALLPLALSGCSLAVLTPGGQVDQANRTILVDSVAIMLAIVVPTMIASLLFAWWFRASNSRARYTPTFEYSGRLELVVWAVPLMTIMLLGGVTWIGAHELDPGVALASSKPPLDVQAVSLDWKWLFIYPGERVAAVNQLVIPAGRPIRFSITSASVLNAFFVPRLGSMIYAMNGMTTHLNLSADAPGTYYGMSSHFSGDGFSDMHFDVRAVPADQFTAWVNTAHQDGPTLDAGSYGELAKQSRHVAPFTYKDADPHLFAAIVSQKMPPGPGPDVHGGQEH